MLFKGLAALVFTSATCLQALACQTPVSVCAHDPGQSLGLIRAGRPVAVVVEAAADPAVQHVGRSFVADLERVAGRPATLLGDIAAAGPELVLIGVLGQSPLIDRLVAEGRIAADTLKGRWEAYRQVVLEHPFRGVQRALVVVGADRRGAVFGTYDISARMGVSPWYWWADVPTPQREQVFIAAGARQDQPGVRYRGIFINDEDPAFSSWAKKKFGGINAQMYGTVFELLLRLKANCLWPAMWPPKAFNADDPQNMVLADQMGVVMGTSHHEPMMRAHDEWRRAQGGAWDYASNGAQLREFWRGGIARMVSRPGSRPYDSLVTIGMRGDGDEPMGQGTAVGLLQGIVADQRRIIAEVTGKPAAQTPQVWALYKEVQAYHDSGMQVPDDVLLLFADDNWGNLRRLPGPGQRRPGGYGVYYHFDYVGGPRNYKWLNTNQIQKVWQQMNLAHARGADALWMVNVGDIKPLEFPISFFMDMAWNPGAMTLEAMNGYVSRWAADHFGPALSPDIAEIVTTYSRYAARRKPELVDAQSFPLGEVAAQALDGGAFGRLVAEWEQLENRVEALRPSLRPDQLDAYFQLVEHPVLALANYYRLQYHVAWNRRLAAAQDARADVFADLAQAAFQRDQELIDRYHAMGGGKWAGMMSQVHIGYTSWQQPSQQLMPATVRLATPGSAPAPDAAGVLRQLGQPARPQAPGVVMVEALNFSRATRNKGLAWWAIPHLGHTSGAVTALPQGRAPTTVADDVRIDYDIETGVRGDARLSVHMVPTLDTRHAGGIRLAVSIDQRPAQLLRMDLAPTGEAMRTRRERDWAQAVKDNLFVLSAVFKDLAPGRHVIKVWRLDDNAVLQKLVLEVDAAAAGGLDAQPAR